jgi:hypothetical protein
VRLDTDFILANIMISFVAVDQTVDPTASFCCLLLIDFLFLPDAPKLYGQNGGRMSSGSKNKLGWN